MKFKKTLLKTVAMQNPQTLEGRTLRLWQTSPTSWQVNVTTFEEVLRGPGLISKVMANDYLTATVSYQKSLGFQEVTK